MWKDKKTLKNVYYIYGCGDDACTGSSVRFTDSAERAADRGDASS